MLQHVIHRNHRAALIRQRRAGKRRANRRHAPAAPRGMRGIEREVEARNANFPALGKHLQKQAAAAADVEHQTLFFGFGERPLGETQMIAQNETAIPLFQPIGRAGFRREPVIRRIVLAQLNRRGLWIEPDQAAVAALHDLKRFSGSPVEAVRGRKQPPGFRQPARRARRQADCSDSSLSVILWRSNSFRISPGLNLCLGRKARRLRSMEGISGIAASVPRATAVAALSLPIGPA
jgi:hypothetical protein